MGFLTSSVWNPVTEQFTSILSAAGKDSRSLTGQFVLGKTEFSEQSPDVNVQISVRHLDFFYGKFQALFDNTIDIYKNRITVIIGPSGCGKSTHIRTYNRIFELYRDQRASGEILMGGRNLLSRDVDVIDLRRRIGMIFQKPSPFPMSVFDNVAYGLKLNYRLTGGELTDRVEEALKRAALWDEIKNKLGSLGTALSGVSSNGFASPAPLPWKPKSF